MSPIGTAALGAVASADKPHDVTLGGRTLPIHSMGWPSTPSPRGTVGTCPLDSHARQVTHRFTYAHRARPTHGSTLPRDPRL